MSQKITEYDSTENSPLLATPTVTGTNYNTTTTTTNGTNGLLTTLIPSRPSSHCSNRKIEDEPSRDKRKLIFVTCLCLMFFVAELVGGYFANSLALMSDAFHLLSDVASFLVSLFAIYLAERPATKRHSFGYHRAEVLAALVSVFIIWVLTAVLVSEAIERVKNPQEIDGKTMFIVAFIGVIVNVILAAVLGHSHDHGKGHDHDHDHSRGHKRGHKKSISGQGRGRGRRHSHSTRRFKRHVHKHSSQEHDHDRDHDHNRSHDHGHEHHADENHDQHASAHAPPIDIEDCEDTEKKKESNINVKAATLHIIGDLISSIGVLISSIIIMVKPDFTIVDPICTFFFSFLVLMTTYRLVIDSVAILMEGTPSHIDPPEVIEELKKIPGVVAVHDLHIWNLTMGKPSLAVHLQITKHDPVSNEALTCIDYDRILAAAQEVVCGKFQIHHSTIQIETGAHFSDHCHPNMCQ